MLEVRGRTEVVALAGHILCQVMEVNKSGWLDWFIHSCWTHFMSDDRAEEVWLVGLVRSQLLQIRWADRSGQG